MKCQISLLLLLVSLFNISLAERNVHMLKARRGAFGNEPALARSNDAALDQNGDLDKLSAVPAPAAAGNGNKDASSGRLFLKKFLMFKNMFSSNNQPVIPIIITSPGTGVTSSNPTTTVTSTGTIPTATGSITSTPTSTGTASTPTTTGRMYNNEQDQDDDAAADDADGNDQTSYGNAGVMAANAELLDEQTMQAALAAGAQEYEVISDDADQTDVGDHSKASQNSNQVMLRRKTGRRGQGQGQVISVRIPPRYRRYFKNGQKVMLNTKNRVNRRRVVRKRVQHKNKRINNRRRGGKNKNKKNKNKKNKNKRPRIPVV